jgi:hypothetical protein
VSTATRRLPDHGTYARGNGSPGYRPPCNCELCAPARRKASKRRKVNRELGRAALIDATPARERLRLLRKTMSWQAINAATHRDDGNLSLIHSGRRTQINRATHNSIMAVRPFTKTDPTLSIDATGTARRIQALFAIGKPRRVIAEAVDGAESYIQKIANRQVATVTQGFADRVDAAYERLAQQPTPHNQFTARTRSNSAAKGWRDVTFWEDTGRIDDPDFDPDAAEKPLRRNELAALRKADVEHLAAYGIDEDEIAERVGLAKSTVHALVEEWRTGTKRDRRKQAVSA